MGEFLFKLKRHLRFEHNEMRDIFVTILVVTFIFAYDDKHPTFMLSHWLFNFLKILIIVIVTIGLHWVAQKMSSLHTGFKAHYKMWSTGLIIGVIFAILTKGKWYIILPGGMLFSHMAVLRLGHFRYGLNYVTQGILAVSGPLANLFFATVFKTFALWGIMPEFFNLMTFINLYYAVFTMLPLPKLDGLYMFFTSRSWYVVIFFFLIGYIFLYTMQFYSLIFAAVVGFAAWLVYYIVFERKVWGIG